MRKGEEGRRDWVSCVHYSKLPFFPPPPLSQRTELRIFVLDFEHVRGGNRSVCVYYSWGWEEGNARNADRKKKKKRISLLIGPNNCLQLFFLKKILTTNSHI